MVFNSKTDRFRSNTYLNTVNNPGPQDYDPNTRNPRYIIKGPIDTKFGSRVERDSLLQRDVSKSPFKNPTSFEVPAPIQYAPRLHEMAAQFSSDANGSAMKNKLSSGNLMENSFDG